jgi:hypothetical protein
MVVAMLRAEPTHILQSELFQGVLSRCRHNLSLHVELVLFIVSKEL